MGKTLDKQKPFGTVHGDDEGRCFTQDGVYFDAAGNECKPQVDEPQPAEAEPQPAEAAKAKKK